MVQAETPGHQSVPKHTARIFHLRFCVGRGDIVSPSSFLLLRGEGAEDWLGTTGGFCSHLADSAGTSFASTGASPAGAAAASARS